jgi:hypothetical protein
MKNLLVYYFALFMPLLLLIAVFQYGLLPSWTSILLLIGYVLIYRTYIDGQRLMDKGLINKEDRWKVITHGLRAKYFRELYLDK